MKAILVLLIALAAVITAACYICYRKVFTFNKNKNTNPLVMLEGEQYTALKDRIVPMVEETLKLPFTDVFCTSFDGLRLHGAYYEVKADAPVEIMCHGYKSIAVRDFSGGIKLALDSGHNVLLIDQRAHGKSEGKCLTFGIKERKDCLSWIEYIIGRNGADTKIILMGMSMGAATVLMASELELPKNVVGIVADSAYTSPKAIICKVIRDMKLPPKLIYPFVYLGARIFGGFDLNSCNSADAVKKCTVPVYIIHGGDDRFVPYEMGRENYDACKSEKVFLKVDGAGHGLAFVIDYDAYIDARRKFYDLLSM